MRGAIGCGNPGLTPTQRGASSNDLVSHYSARETPSLGYCFTNHMPMKVVGGQGNYCCGWSTGLCIELSEEKLHWLSESGR